jgi:Histone deacetylation protein Rxt3
VKADEDGLVPRPQFTGQSRSETPQAAGNSGMGPQKHHHHHHHHQTKKEGGENGQGPREVPPPFKKLKLTIESDKVLTAASSHARRHLDTVSYTSTATSSLKEIDGVTLTPTPLPHYSEDEINCTVTVQIPRFYLEDARREKITRHRAVWGTDVYTDDSDVLAAAIHAGWVKGKWGEDIDEAFLLGLSNIPEAGKKAKKISKDDEKAKLEAAAKAGKKGDDLSITERPERPVTPPAGHDAQITVILLPRLEKYRSLARNGLKSRKWGKNHDGLSFKLEKLTWVEGLGEPRTGAERRILAANTNKTSLMRSNTADGFESGLEALAGVAGIKISASGDGGAWVKRIVKEAVTAVEAGKENEEAPILPVARVEGAEQATVPVATA